MIEGKSLMDEIKQKTKLNEILVQKYIFQISKSLHYIHTKGVIHRDLKVDNILISNSGVIKIIGINFFS